ncbi:MAG: DNA primase [Candidatus Niyogibacteria bacterium]|nr:DNA primase [Candidatus Niyogibacteria bacterium]
MASPVEEIKEKLDIAELIGSYVKLEKAGQNFKAICPFHTEKTPSFYVSPARQMWHCFGCSAGGDIFRFVMNIEGIEFPEALRLLAEKAGIELRREDPKVRSERTRLLDLLDDAAEFYEKNLVERKDVGVYLKERGMTGETAKSFRIGYALNAWDSAVSYLRKSGYKPEEIEKAGLAVKSERDEGYHDRFRARIMFPLFDSAGRAVGFSGRIFEKDLPAQNGQEAPAKYINTPQTALYDKSRVLYGFDRAKTEIRKKNSAVILEGQMDLIMSHQSGVANAVAVSGTALTAGHLAGLKRLCDTLVMSFDTDAAGFEATKKSVDLALSAGFEIMVATLPQAVKDPAELIKANPQGWPEALSSAKPVISFLLNSLAEKFPDPLAFKKEVSRSVLPYIAAVRSEITRAHWVAEAARAMKIREESVWQELGRIGASGKSGSVKIQSEEPRARQQRNRRTLLEERLIGLACLKKEDLVPVFADCGPEWFSPERRPIFEASLSGSTEDHYFKKLALEAEVVYASSEDLSVEVRDLSKELKKENLKEKLVMLGQSIKDSEHSGEKADIEKKFEEFKLVSAELNSL